MNLTDAMLLERMQQLAASMALPQMGGASQNVQPKTNKDGASFQDLMDRAQSGKESTQKTSTAKDTQKSEQTDETAPAQEVKGKPVFKDDPRVKEMDPHTQAMVAAGIAALTELEDGTIMVAIPASELPCVTMTPLLPNGEPDLSQPIVVQTGSGQVFKVWLDGEEPVVERTVLTPEESARFQDALIQETRQTEDGAETVVLPKEAPKAELQNKESAQEGQEEEQRPGEEKFQTAVIREPLFKAFEGTPVKVGENFHTVDTQAADMDAQLAQAIQEAAQSGEQSMIIKLTPENLGNLTIQITQSGDGALQVVLHANSAKAAGVLNEHLDSLNLALQNLSGSPVKVEVQRHEDSQQAQQHPFQQADPDGHNRQQQQQQQRRQEEARSEDFVQQLRLGLFKLEDIL